MKGTDLKKKENIGKPMEVLEESTGQEAQEKLWESEERYRVVTETALVGITIADPEENLTLVNTAFAEMVGYSQEELLGMNLSMLTDQEEFNEYKKQTQRRKKGLCSFYESKLMCKDGTGKNVRVSASPLLGVDGCFNGTVAVITDITDLKKAEQALRSSAQEWKKTFDAIGDAVCLVDKDSRILRCNRAMKDLAERPFEEIIGRTCCELVHGSAEPIPGCPMSRALETCRRETMTIPIGDRWHYVVVDPIPGEDGSLVGGVHIVRDITQQKRAEEALRESEERHKTLFESAAEGILIADIRTKRFRYPNPAVSKMLGYSVDELKRMSVADIHPKESLEHVIAEFEAQARGEKTLASDIPCLKKDGTVMYADINTAKALIDGIECNVGFFTDITERKRAQEERGKMEEHLRQLQKMEALGTMAGGMAHDFNNLLTAIRGYSEFGLMKSPEDSVLRPFLSHIREASIRAAGLTEQLVQFSRRQPLALKPLGIKKLISDMVNMFRQPIGQETAIVTDFAPDLWAVRGDARNIKQAILSMLVNARDAMPEGGTIVIRAVNAEIDEEYCRNHDYGKPGRFVCLSIEDTGVGMDDGTRPHIFEPFFTTKERCEGIGLGLSAAYGIVKQHKGWIDVKSTQGQGSCFMVYLPSSPDGPEEERPEGDSAEAPKGRGERVLVVEDEDDVRELAESVLRDNGYTVFAVVDRREALYIFSREGGKFDLVFSDIVLPDGSGVNLVERFVARKPELRVLLASGYTEEIANWQTFEEKGYHFLQKPYAVTDLLCAVRELLDKKR
ncbi:PAS domain S-box protein [candidate division TA06 bacterium]|uniref:histidine kinase n=1 Tax=candidate division TA06 bacterium TaxID=2250710 RepID=A0A523USW3_UNCT6|nr:MAG: PAS domain S-box protein [candidate division TA06 bacterium]